MSYLCYLCFLAQSGVQHIHWYCVVFLFCFSSSLQCPFFIVPSVFSNVYLLFMVLYRQMLIGC